MADDDASVMFPDMDGGAPQPAASVQPARPLAQEPVPADGDATAGAPTTMYDMPDDGVNYGEPDASSVDALGLEMPSDFVVTDPEQLQQVNEALVAAGVGHTLKNALMELATPYLRPDAPPPMSDADALTQMRGMWGSQTDAKLAAARSMVDEAAKKWPGVKQWLNQTGLGNDPRLIEKLAARAARRPQRWL